MSEYQYYEFRSIDRPLDRRQQDELRALSSRSEITPTSLRNTYNYGDFRGEPAALMDRYFDAFVYVANWGTRRLMFRFPRRLFDVEAASAYCDDESLSLKVGEEHVVLEFSSRDEPEGQWVQGEHWMASLIPLRDDLIRGDFRALYLGWLASARSSGRYDEGEDGDEEQEPAEDGGPLEPPVPPGLARLSGPLRSLAEFLRLDDELIRAAAEGGEAEPPAEPSHAEWAGWIKGLTATDKEDYLLRLLTEETASLLRAEMGKRYREATTPRAVAGGGRRPLKQLLEAGDTLAEEKARQARDREAQERAHRDRERAEARSRYLDDLAPREPATWREVEELIATKLPKNYDRAVALLVDLRDLAARSGLSAEAEARVREIRDRHAGKPSLMKRFTKHQLE